MRHIFLVMLLVSGFVAVNAAQTPPSAAQEGFVPIDRAEVEEQLPAAPLVAAAYGVAWAAVLIYVWFVKRRLARVERELADVARRLERTR